MLLRKTKKAGIMMQHPKNDQLTAFVLAWLLAGGAYSCSMAEAAGEETIIVDSTPEHPKPDPSGAQAERPSDNTKWVTDGYGSSKGGISLDNGYDVLNVTLKDTSWWTELYAFKDEGVGNVENYSIKLTTGTGAAIRYLYGGYSSDGKVSNNHVTWSADGGDINDGGYYGATYGGYSETNEASFNDVRVESYGTGTRETTSHRIYGGYSKFGSAESNYVKIDNKQLLNDTEIVGGYAAGSAWGSDPYGNANKNVVEVYEAGKIGELYGGYACAGDASHNKVSIYGENVGWSFPLSRVMGGYAYGGDYYNKKGSADDNEVWIHGGRMRNVYGGYGSSYGTANRNLVNITGGTILEGVHGGFSYNYNTEGGFVSVEGNTVNISNATIGEYGTGRNVWGGEGSGHVKRNIVNFVSGSAGTIYGGVASYDASENVVTFSGGTVDGIYGGKAGSIASENKLYIFKKEAGDVLATGDTAEFYAGYSSGASALNNEVILGANVDEDGKTVVYPHAVELPKVTLHGGAAFGSGTASGNTLHVYNTGNKAKGVQDFQKYSFYVPDTAWDRETPMLTAENSAVANTEVTLSEAPTDKLILLRNTTALDLTGTSYKVGTKTATLNAPFVWSATDKGTHLVVVSGGLKSNPKDLYWDTDKAFLAGTFTDNEGNRFSAGDAPNTVTLSSHTVIPQGVTEAYGSYRADGSKAEGGVINIVDGRDFSALDLIGGYSTGGASMLGGNTLNVRAEGAKIHNLSDFSNIDFYVPDTATNGTVMLECTDLDNPTSLEGTYVRTGISSHSRLAKKDKVILLKNGAKGIIVDDATKWDAQIVVDSWLPYKGSVALENNDKELVLTLDGDEPPGPPTPNAKSFAETRAASMALLKGAADQAAGITADKLTDGKKGYQLFASMRGESLRYDTGSYVDSKGWGLNLGWGRLLPQEDGEVFLAPFLEYGRAGYDSYLDNGVHGSGTNQHFGLGFLARKIRNNGVHYEGSVRFGRMRSDYEGLSNRYDSNFNYMAFHAGIGKRIALGEKRSIDCYAKLFYTHQNGDNADLRDSPLVDFGSINFEAMDSFRTRLGFRYDYQEREDSIFYAGLAWDYEFKGDACSSYQGHSILVPSLKGSTGMLELGWKRPHTEENRLAVDVTLMGFAGKQRGVVANCMLDWAF